LAKKVSMSGQLGTVSGVAFEKIFARMLQKGDPDGHLRRALSHFPFQEEAERVLEAFFVEGGKPENEDFKVTPVFTIKPSPLLISLTVCANFALVWLAMEGHSNPISINYLVEVVMPHPYAITGAMMAAGERVLLVTAGAGIPRQFPDVFKAIVEGRTVKYHVPVRGKNIKGFDMKFNPEQFFGDKLPPMELPGLLPIVSSNALAQFLAKKLPKGSIFGFVVEEPTAGGHNANPRDGEEYGPKDEVDYSKIADLGLPFWVAGSKASPEKLKSALSVGASGIQVGGIFALCEQSGMDPKLRKEVYRLWFQGKLVVNTDKDCSSTGFRFKVVAMDGTLSDPEVYASRVRVCNQGALVALHERSDGSIGYRCSAEDLGKFGDKGGDVAEEKKKKTRCLCNGLISTAGFGNSDEPPIVTLGDDVSFLKFLMENENSSYSAEDAIRYLLG